MTRLERPHSCSDSLPPREPSQRACARAPPGPRARDEAMTSPLIALALAGRPQWGARDYASLAREGVMQNAIVYRCVRMIAEGAASIPWLLYEGAARARNPSAAHAADPSQCARKRQRIVRALVCASAMRGQRLSRSAHLDGTPRELYVLRPDRMKIVPGARGWPAAYDYTVDGRTTRIARRRVRLHAGAARHAVPSARRSLRPLADRGGGARRRHPQCRRRLDQGAARQCGPSLRRADLSVAPMARPASATNSSRG